MFNEIKLMKPKSKDKLTGRDSIQVITDTKEEILVYSEPEGGLSEPNIVMPDIYKVIHNNIDYNGGKKMTLLDFIVYDGLLKILKSVLCIAAAIGLYFLVQWLVNDKK